MNEETPWTSLDLYYKGFHIKKSFPSNFSAGALIEKIDELIEKGFKPSWNAETNGKNEPKEPTPHCPIHNVDMTFRQGVSKSTGKSYASWACPNKNPDGSFCSYKPDMNVQKGVQ